MLGIYARVVVFGCVFITTIYAAVTCPKGTFVSKSARTSGCQTCQNGTYSDLINSTKCLKCDNCRGKQNSITQACNKTSNTQCKCRPGYYIGGFLFCLKCRPCKRGKGVIKNCTSLSDTVCGVCEKGNTYSENKDFSPCKPCTKCQKGDELLKECTRRTDTVCIKETDKNRAKIFGGNRERSATVRTASTSSSTSTDQQVTNERWKPSPTRNSTTNQRPSSSSQHSGDKVENVDFSNEGAYIIALCVLGGFAAVIFVILFAVVITCRKKRRSRNLAKPGEKEKGEEPSTSSSISEGMIGAQENPYTSLPLIGGARQGPDLKMLRDVPYTLINELSRYLNPGGRWKDLGGRLNFNHTQISNFALVKKNATQAMLEEWGQRDYATVVALQKVFHSMKWSKEERICAEFV